MNRAVLVCVAATAAALLHAGALAVRVVVLGGQGFAVDEVAPALAGEFALALASSGAVLAVVAELVHRVRPARVAPATALGAAALFAGLAFLTPDDPRELGPGPSAASSSGARTVVLVTLDTLRRDHVSAYPEAVFVDGTPTLAALAADGVRFDGAIAPAPLTLPAHTSLLSGRWVPDHHVVRNGQRLPDEIEGVPPRLAAVGYRTAAFVSSSVLHGAHGLSRWFSVYRDALGDAPIRKRLPLSARVLDVPEPARLEKEPGDRTVDRALSWLARHPGERVFVWVHLYDAHAPHASRPDVGAPTWDALPNPCLYVGHPGMRVLAAPSKILSSQEPLWDAARCATRDWSALHERTRSYAAEVAFVDAQVGRLIDGLRKLDRWDDTAIVVAADHGESLTEHQQYLSHQYSLYDPVARVPLILRTPAGRGRGRTVDGVVSTAVIAATLARLGGASGDGLLGPDLVALADGAEAPGVAVTLGPLARPPRTLVELHADQIAVRTATHKVIAFGPGRTERYDLASDPREARPLRLATDAPLVEELVGPVAPRRMRTLGLPGLPAPSELFARGRARAEMPDGDPTLWTTLDAPGPFDPLDRSAAEWRAVLDAPSPSARDVELPDDVRQALEALGYVQ